jgi:hypothetical protein
MPSPRRLAVVCLLASCGGPASEGPKGTTTDEPPTTGVPTTSPTGPTEPTVPDPTLPTPVDSADTGLPPCSPALALSADRTSAEPDGLVTLQASGGSGAWRFALAGDAAGTLDPTSGFYLAADEPGTTDEIVLTDEQCAGSATVSVQTVEALSALPSRTEVLPGTAFTVQSTGGTGSISCALAETASGATLSGCDYTAGSADGFDRVVITDAGTLQTAEARITVSADARVDALGAEGWVIPLGATFLPETIGGSGVLEIDGGSDVVDVQDGLLVAHTAGTDTVTLTDPFAGWQAQVPVTVAGPYVPASDWYGQQTQLGHAEVADLDGDGFDDVVFALVEINDGAYYTGGVVVYAGTATGLDPVPVWSAAGRNAYAYLGRSLHLADLDDDGAVDLLVGADGADFTFDDVGEVQVFYGQAGGWFESTPRHTLRGQIGGDRAGSALTSCDLDGDGYRDVIVGAYGAEDRDLDDYPNSMGALMVFPGSANGLPSEPAQVRYGLLPDDGAWVAEADTRIGEYGLAAGDLDGDGLCDVVAGSYTRSVELGDTDNYGLAMAWHGQPGTLLSATPTRVWANDVDSYAELGRELALADLDGDGLDDLVATAPYMDGDLGGSQGQALIWLAASDDGRPATEPVFTDEADHTVTGRTTNDYLGRDLHLADVTGDGVLDVVTGEPQAPDTADTLGNVGRISVWSGAELLALPFGGGLGEGSPWHEYLGSEAGEFTGQAFALLDDRDGDGLPEVFTFAGRSDALGTNVGEPRLITSQGVTTALQMPGGPSGHDHARDLVLFDADDDGVLDLLVGSPEDGDPDLGNATGALTSFAGLGDGTFASVGERIGSYGTRGGGDRFGDALATTDFDGDGVLDLVATARNDGFPSSLDTDHFVDPSGCIDGTSRNGAGMVAIWRGGEPIGLREPDWIWWGPRSGGNVREVVGGLDHDGDGRGDVVAGSRSWSDGSDGGIARIAGRAPDPSGLTLMMCDAQMAYAIEDNTYLGDSLVALPDLDGDGCDEVAAGSPLEDADESNQGVVRIFWGAGAGCGSPTVTALAAGSRNAHAGESLAVGRIDDDAVRDLVVGGDGFVDDSDLLGTVWVVPGSWLLSLPREPIDGDELPDGPFHDLVPGDAHYGLVGPLPTADFAETVATLPDPARPGRDAVWVGLPDGDLGGGFQAGGALAYRWVDDPLGTGLPGLSPLPFVVVGGETHLPGGRLGDTLRAAAADGLDLLLLGAPTSSQGGVAVGGAYVVPQ